MRQLNKGAPLKTSTNITHPLRNLAEKLSVSMAIFGGVLLLLSATMVLCSVLGRALFNSPLPGDFELLEIGAACSVFSFLPLLMYKQGNVIVPVLSAKLAPKYLKLLDNCALLFFCLCYALLGFYGALGAYETFLHQITSQILGIPLYFGIAYASFCFIASLGVCLILLLASENSAARGAKN